MTQAQLNVLNALVTFAMENLPGGPMQDEEEIARIVGGWAIDGKIDDGEDRSLSRFIRR